MDKDDLIGHEIKMLSNLIKRYIDSNIARHNGIDSEGNSDRSNHELTGMQSLIIKYLYYNDSKEVFQRDIEKKFNIRRSTSTRILQLMEKKGLINRTSVDYDARLKKLKLTQKSIELHRMIEQDIDTFEIKMREEISEEEMNAFMKTIRKIRSNIE